MSLEVWHAGLLVHNYAQKLDIDLLICFVFDCNYKEFYSHVTLCYYSYYSWYSMILVL